MGSFCRSSPASFGKFLGKQEQLASQANPHSVWTMRRTPDKVPCPTTAGHSILA